jgi:hypothetical protein
MQAQGALGQVLMQMENAYKVLPTNVKSKKLYIESESISFSQDLSKSNVIRGGVRHPTSSVRGTVDVGGDIKTELMATSPLLYAAMGSMETTMVGGTMGTALTTPAATIDSVNQLMTVTVTSHGLTVGDSVEIAGLTAPTSLNGKIWPVIAVPTVNTFILRLPMGTTSTFTLGSGTIKKVTAAGVCTHTMKAGGKLPSYVIESGFTDIGQYFRYLGSVCGKLALGSISAAGIIPLTASFMGASETTATTPFDATPLDNGKRSFDNQGIAAAAIKEGGTAIANIFSIDGITLDNSLDGDTFVVGGGGSRAAINPGIYGVSGSVKAMFEDMTLYNKAKNLTESSIDFTVTRGTGDGTDGNEKFQCVIPELVYKAKSPAIEGPKGVVVDLAFEGFYDNAADATAFKMIVTNSLLPGAMI